MSRAIVKAYIDLPWGQVHLRTVASGAAARWPVFLLHQSPLSSRNYEQLLPLLTGPCHPVALDTPGYGSSSPAPAHWEVEDYANAVWDAADALGWPGQAVLFGRATGAVFALQAALSRPDRVRCLILHGMPVYTDAERAHRMAHFAPPLPLQADGSHLQRIWDRIQGEYPWIDPALATHLAADFLAAGPDFAQSYRAIWRYDLAHHARAGTGCPTLLLGGSADRIAFMHARAVALLPNAESLVLNGATDFVAEQAPVQLARPVQDFIARHC